MLSSESIRQKDRYIKAAFESVRVSDQASFLIREFEEPRFLAPYHFHPEYELTWIVRGCGKRYVGAHMCDYFPDDLVLLGATLPHCWKTVAAAEEAPVAEETAAEVEQPEAAAEEPAAEATEETTAEETPATEQSEAAESTEA